MESLSLEIFYRADSWPTAKLALRLTSNQHRVEKTVCRSVWICCLCGAVCGFSTLRKTTRINITFTNSSQKGGIYVN